MGEEPWSDCLCFICNTPSAYAVFNVLHRPVESKAMSGHPGGMNASINFSIFIGDGSAFGMVTVTLEMASTPLVGDVVEMPCLDCYPRLDFVDGFPFRVEAVHLEPIPHHMIACDIVLATQSHAWRLVERLNQVDADCDVWGWTKTGASWKKY